jgi:hypothetical protein
MSITETKLTVTTLDGSQSISFAYRESPEEFKRRHTHHLAVHDQIGGQRWVDSMGQDQGKIEWSSLFLDKERVDFVATLQSKGEEVLVTCSSYAYIAVIEEFHHTYKHDKWHECNACLVVVQDLTQPVFSIPEIGIEEAMWSLNTDIGVYIQQLDNPVLQLAYETLQTAILAVSSFAKMASGQINAILTPIAILKKQVQILMGSIGNTAINVGTFGGVLAAPAAIAGFGVALQKATQALNNQAILSKLDSSLGLMVGNLNRLKK